MKYRTRTYYTDSQKALMWERWKAGKLAGLFIRSLTCLIDRMGPYEASWLSRAVSARPNDIARGWH